MYILIFITAKDKKEACGIARALVKKKLAACVNIVGKVDSLFWWQAKVDSQAESLLVVKSKKSKLNGIIRLVKSLHSYAVPEIIALPILGGDRKYLDWIDESLR